MMVLGASAPQLKLCGPGDWLVEKHGTGQRRAWRKLHVGLDAATGGIVAATRTDHDVDDASQVDPLLDQIVEPLNAIIADGAYDQSGVYEAVDKRHPGAIVVVPPRSTAVPSDTARSEPTPRDRHLQAIADGGRMAWQAASGYNVRARGGRLQPLQTRDRQWSPLPDRRLAAVRD